MNASTYIVTGSARGIGRGTAMALAKRGCTLGLIDRNAELLEDSSQAIRALGVTVVSAVADVTDRSAIGSAIDSIESAVGPVKVLVACAGIGGLTQIPQLDLDEFKAMLNVNVIGVANSIDAVLAGMITRGGGHIVGVSSVVGYRGMPWMASYSASKAACTAYLEALRPALKRRGVTITTACPGMVRTALTEGTPFRNPIKMMEPEEAGRQIARAAFRRPRNCVFPLSTSVGMAFLRHVPDSVFDWMMDRAGPRALSTEF